MNSKALVGGVIAIIIVIVGFMFLHSGSSQPSSSPTPQPSMSMPPQSTGSSSSQASSSPTSAKNAVQIANFAFSPARLTIKAGDSVTWTNQDSVGHSATADDGSFDTGILAQGSSGTITFSKAGTFTYHCKVHPMMHGTIIVQ